MKLESTLPERPGLIFVTPGFDFVLLLLALVMLTGVVARESLVEVQLPPSEFRGVRIAEEKLVLVTVRQGRDEPVFYVGKEKVGRDQLEVAIQQAVDSKSTSNVTVQCDERISLGVEQELTDLVTRLGLRYFRVVSTRKDGDKP